MTKPPVRIVAVLWGLLALAAVAQAIPGSSLLPGACRDDRRRRVDVQPIGKDSVRFP